MKSYENVRRVLQNEDLPIAFVNNEVSLKRYNVLIGY